MKRGPDKWEVLVCVCVCITLLAEVAGLVRDIWRDRITSQQEAGTPRSPQISSRHPPSTNSSSVFATNAPPLDAGAPGSPLPVIEGGRTRQ